MTPSQLYAKIARYLGGCNTVVCDLHSACSPAKRKTYLCGHRGSGTAVIDFDSVKTKADKERGIESRKSVDAVAVSPSQTSLCFIELKSWELLLTNKGTEEKIRKQTEKYESDLPRKLSDSMEICRQICEDDSAFNDCRIIFILVVDIAVEEDGLANFQASISALAGTSSDLKMLYNRQSADIMQRIPNVETRYWYCRNLDSQLAAL